MGCTKSTGASQEDENAVVRPAAKTKRRKSRARRRGDRAKKEDAPLAAPPRSKEVHATAREEVEEQQRQSRAIGSTTAVAAAVKSTGRLPNPLEPSATDPEDQRESQRRDARTIAPRPQRREERAILSTNENGPDQAGAARRGVSWRVHIANLRLSNPGIASLAAYVSQTSNRNLREGLLSVSKLSRIHQWIDRGVHRDLLDPQDLKGHQLRESREMTTSESTSDRVASTPATSPETRSATAAPLSPMMCVEPSLSMEVMMQGSDSRDTWCRLSPSDLQSRV